MGLSDIGSEAWLRERFPERDWHRHPRGISGDTQLCDGTPSDCPRNKGGQLGDQKVVESDHD